MELGDKKNLFINSKTLLEEIKETSATEVLTKMKQSFKNDEWSEELKLQAVACYSVVIMGILSPCAVLDNDILDLFAKGVDDYKPLMNLMYPAIASTFDDLTEGS